MTARYPLVLNGTSIQELQSGDTVAGVEFFPAGTAMLFIQAAAPTGWTKSTTLNDYALRIVSGTGGGTGGSTAFSTALGASGTSGATTLSTSQIPSHNHTISAIASPGSTYLGGGNSYVYAAVSSTGYTGGGGSHTHSLGINVNYVDAIICTKN